MDNIAAEISEHVSHEALVRQQQVLFQIGDINVATLNGEFYVYRESQRGFSVFQSEDEAIQLAWKLGCI